MKLARWMSDLARVLQDARRLAGPGSSFQRVTATDRTRVGVPTNTINYIQNTSVRPGQTDSTNLPFYQNLNEKTTHTLMDGGSKNCFTCVD